MGNEQRNGQRSEKYHCRAINWTISGRVGAVLQRDGNREGLFGSCHKEKAGEYVWDLHSALERTRVIRKTLHRWKYLTFCFCWWLHLFCTLNTFYLTSCLVTLS